MVINELDTLVSLGGLSQELSERLGTALMELRLLRQAHEARIHQGDI